MRILHRKSSRKWGPDSLFRLCAREDDRHEREKSSEHPSEKCYQEQCEIRRWGDGYCRDSIFVDDILILSILLEYEDWISCIIHEPEDGTSISLLIIEDDTRNAITIESDTDTGDIVCIIEKECRCSFSSRRELGSHISSSIREDKILTAYYLSWEWEWEDQEKKSDKKKLSHSGCGVIIGIFDKRGKSAKKMYRRFLYTILCRETKDFLQKSIFGFPVFVYTFSTFFPLSCLKILSPWSVSPSWEPTSLEISPLEVTVSRSIIARKKWHNPL